MLAIPSSVWKVCHFHYSLSRFTAAVVMFLHGGPGGRRQALWPCEPGPQRCECRREGVAAALLDTHMRYMWSFKDIAGRAWLLAGCYQWQESRSRLPGTGLRLVSLVIVVAKSRNNRITGALNSRLTDKPAGNHSWEHQSSSNRADKTKGLLFLLFLSLLFRRDTKASKHHQ